MNEKKFSIIFATVLICPIIIYYISDYISIDDFFTNEGSSNKPALVIEIPNNYSAKRNNGIDKPRLLNYKEKPRGIVKPELLNCRESPWGKVKAILHKGDIVDVEAFENDWFIINLNNDKLYVHSKFLEVDGYSNNNSPDYGILINDADIFDFNGKNIGKLDKGKRVNILFNADNYWKIQNNDGEAFVFKSDVKILPDFKP